VSATAALDALAVEIRAHRGCGFEPCETCTNPVPGEGSAQAELMFVGEAPGAQEDQRGRPFVGAAGRLLDELLGSIGLRREEVFITNVLKARPPENRDPRPGEVEHSWPWLEAELGLVSPRLVVPLGRHALGRFVPGPRISEVHGTLLEHDGRRYFPLLHPAVGLYGRQRRGELLAGIARLPAALSQLEAQG
jgi:uracil-DNA glycosylase family 4